MSRFSRKYENKFISIIAQCWGGDLNRKSIWKQGPICQNLANTITVDNLVMQGISYHGIAQNFTE